jgi:hypothetical protein
MARADDCGAPGTVGNAIDVVGDGENARVISETELGQDLQSPERLSRDREAWCAVSLNLRAARLFDRLLGAAGVFAELIRVEREDRAVPVGVARHLVATRHDLAHQLGLPFANPSQNEEGGLNLCRTPEEVEETDACSTTREGKWSHCDRSTTSARTPRRERSPHVDGEDVGLSIDYNDALGGRLHSQVPAQPSVFVLLLNGVARVLGHRSLRGSPLRLAFLGARDMARDTNATRRRLDQQ